MAIARDCYSPAVFRPSNTPLLSLRDWHMMQLYLVDAINLPVRELSTFPADVAPIYTRLQAEAVEFHGTTLPAAQIMGNALYRYGSMAATTFGGVVELMDQPKPDKDAILQALANLRRTAESHQVAAAGVGNRVERYATSTQAASRDLSAATIREASAISADKLNIQVLQGRFNQFFADKQQAQAAIVGDRDTIDKTKYYVWIPFVGTVVGLAKIAEANADIRHQVERISYDIQQMTAIQAEIQHISSEVSHLTYAAQYNQHMAEEITGTMHGIQLILAAWKTIASELGLVVENIQAAAVEELANDPCLASVALATAASEWSDIAKDAQTFTLNFYVCMENAA